MKRILLTGITGYIGSNIARALLSEGYEVYGIIRPGSSVELLKDIKDQVSLYEYKGTGDSLDPAFKENNIDLVIHIAGLFIAEHREEEVDKLLAGNIILGTHLLEAMNKYKVNYLINTGSSWQNYEGASYDPVNLYSAMKEAFEIIARFYTAATPLRMITLRLTDTYGPGDRRNKIINRFYQIADTGEALSMSEGEQEISLVYIDDIIKAYGCAIEKIKNLEEHEQVIYSVVSREVHSLKEVAKIFEQVTKKTMKIDWGKREYRKREVMKVNDTYPNILEEQQMTSLEEGFQKMTAAQDGGRYQNDNTG